MEVFHSVALLSLRSQRLKSHKVDLRGLEVGFSRGILGRQVKEIFFIYLFVLPPLHAHTDTIKCTEAHFQTSI